jgi:hypothetical protein
MTDTSASLPTACASANNPIVNKTADKHRRFILAPMIEHSD